MVFFTENGSNLLFLGVKTGKCPLSIETGHFNRNRTLQSKPDTSDDTGHFGKNRTNMSKNGQNCKRAFQAVFGMLDLKIPKAGLAQLDAENAKLGDKNKSWCGAPKKSIS